MFKKQPLILIPGLLSNHRVWAHQTKYLQLDPLVFFSSLSQSGMLT